MKARARVFDLMIQEALEELYLKDESFSETESETEEEIPYTMVDDIDYDGIADLFKQAPTPITLTKLSTENVHDDAGEKSERDFDRYRDANNKAKLASKQHRFEMAAKREEDALQKMGLKQEYESQRLFQKHPSRNNRRYHAVSEAIQQDNNSLRTAKK